MNFKLGDKVRVIPWDWAKETNLYNSIENDVYGISEESWFESGKIVAIIDNCTELLISDYNGFCWELPVEFLTKEESNV